VAWVALSVADGNDARGWLLTLLTTAWGLRLATYLSWRNIGHGEDYRYKAMRKHHGAKFPLVSLFTVFILQGVLMWLVSLPVQLGQVSRGPDIGVLGIVGIAFLLLDFSSKQLATFSWLSSRPTLQTLEK
jgi:steroid 5-alpha reductase family enzyme